MQSLVDKINAVEAGREINKAYFVEQRKMIKAFAPVLWGSLHKMLKVRSESITNNTKTRIVFEPINNNEVKLKNGETGAWILLEFDPETPCVWFRTPGPSNYWTFRVNTEGNGVMFFDHQKDVPMFADELAEVCIAMIVSQSA